MPDPLNYERLPKRQSPGSTALRLAFFLTVATFPPVTSIAFFTLLRSFPSISFWVDDYTLVYLIHLGPAATVAAFNVALAIRARREFERSRLAMLLVMGCVASAMLNTLMVEYLKTLG